MQNIFERYEKKYLISREQAAALLNIIARRMTPDRFGEYLVQNIYYDANSWDVVRASIEKPFYKEKMRLRCYGTPNRDSQFFLELKKKYNGVVYKRRVAIPSKELYDSSIKEIVSKGDSQISRELDFYLKTNAVSEKIYIAYHRLAFAGVEDEGLRVTFDANMRFRLEQLNFVNPGKGRAILPLENMLMEVKTLGGTTMWLARALSEHGIFPTTFSKYGVCYTDHIFKGLEERREKINAIGA